MHQWEEQTLTLIRKVEMGMTFPGTNTIRSLADYLLIILLFITLPIGLAYSSFSTLLCGDTIQGELTQEDMDFFGMCIDEDKNKKAVGIESNISSQDATMKVFVVPTNEELEIANECKKFLI